MLAKQELPIPHAVRRIDRWGEVQRTQNLNLLYIILDLLPKENTVSKNNKCLMHTFAVIKRDFSACIKDEILNKVRWRSDLKTTEVLK